MLASPWSAILSDVGVSLHPRLMDPSTDTVWYSAGQYVSLTRPTLTIGLKVWKLLHTYNRHSFIIKFIEATYKTIFLVGSRGYWKSIVYSYTRWYWLQKFNLNTEFSSTCRFKGVSHGASAIVLHEYQYVNKIMNQNNLITYAYTIHSSLDWWLLSFLSCWTLKRIIV